MTDATSSPEGEQTLDRSEGQDTAADSGVQPTGAPAPSTADESRQHAGATAPAGAAASKSADRHSVPSSVPQRAAAVDAAQPTAAADQVAEIEGDLDELMKMAAERDKYLGLAQRTQADFENYRKRVARDAAAAQERGVSSLVKELLPALDNLDRALEAAAQDDPLLQGVRLVRSELSAALARAGIESFSPAGETFDPEVHEAVATAPQGPNGAQSGTVVEVYQPGYRMGASIIRPARVLVAA
jgi:molecular chaperone GrpE